MGCSFTRQRKKKLIAFSGDSVFIPHTAAAASRDRPRFFDQVGHETM